jgi:hypothetical protein
MSTSYSSPQTFAKVERTFFQLGSWANRRRNRVIHTGAPTALRQPITEHLYDHGGVVPARLRPFFGSVASNVLRHYGRVRRDEEKLASC